MGLAMAGIGHAIGPRHKDPNTLLEPQCATELPGIIGCNLICLGCEEFGKLYGFECFENFQCLSAVHPVVFSQFCTFFHQEKLKAQTESEGQDTTNVSSLGISSKDKKKTLLKNQVKL